MPKCPLCGRLLSVFDHQCSSCGYTDDEQTAVEEFHSNQDGLELFSSRGEKMDCIARFGNSAEAGYFADELGYAKNIEAKITVREQFDALSGRWTPSYLIAVEQSQSEQAATFLHQLVAETDQTDFTEQDPPEKTLAAGTSMVTDGNVNWLPILLTTLAAGSAVYWGAGRVEQQLRPPALINKDEQRFEDLWNRLADQKAPWVQPMGEDGGVRLFWIQPNKKVAIVQEDVDGDGHVDRELRFRRQ